MKPIPIICLSVYLLFGLDNLHVAMRATSGFISDQGLSTSTGTALTWLSDTFTPAIDTEITPNYFSPDIVLKELYKSPIVECAWDKVSKVSEAYLTFTIVR